MQYKNNYALRNKNSITTRLHKSYFEAQRFEKAALHEHDNSYATWVFLRAVVVATGEYKHRRREADAFTTIYNCIIHDSEIARMFVIVDT